MEGIVTDRMARVAHYNMAENKKTEHYVATLVSAIHAVFFPEPTILLSTEKPPSNNPKHKRRRVDGITQRLIDGTWDLRIGAVWEYKKPDAAPAEIETCEAQVYDACEMYLENKSGLCYGFSVIGSFWGVFTYKQPGAKFTCITGEGDANLNYYYDITSLGEGLVIDSCLRDLREHMGYSRHGIRLNAMALYPRATLNTQQLAYVHHLRRNKYANAIWCDENSDADYITGSNISVKIDVS